MDPALKQRMLGAAVLIVLAIIFVPMLLDGAPSGRSETVDLTIPDAPDRDFETRVVPLDSGAAAVPSATDPNAVATVQAAATKPADALAGAEPPDVAVAPTPAPVATPVPAATPTPAALPQSASGGRYAVSFGTYGKRENADKLVADLKRAQVPAYADEVSVDGKPMLRVRAGPFVDRTQAEKARLLARQARADVALHAQRGRERHHEQRQPDRAHRGDRSGAAGPHRAECCERERRRVLGDDGDHVDAVQADGDDVERLGPAHDRIMRGAQAGEDRLCLDIGSRRHVAVTISVRAKIANSETIQLAGRLRRCRHRQAAWPKSLPGGWHRRRPSTPEHARTNRSATWSHARAVPTCPPRGPGLWLRPGCGITGMVVRRGRRSLPGSEWISALLMPDELINCSAKLL